MALIYGNFLAVRALQGNPADRDFGFIDNPGKCIERRRLTGYVYFAVSEFLVAMRTI
jgi:hypothetical protein